MGVTYIPANAVINVHDCPPYNMCIIYNIINYFPAIQYFSHKYPDFFCGRGGGGGITSIIVSICSSHLRTGISHFIVCMCVCFVGVFFNFYYRVLKW